MQNGGVGERMRLAIDVLLGRPPEDEEVRGRLALALITCLDSLEEDEEAAAEARTALLESGFVPLGAEGERFDRMRHRAQGRVPTEDPGLEWKVATCARAGWLDGERVLRLADVWVYRLDAEKTGG